MTPPLLRLATDEEKRDRDRLAYAEWGDRLDVEQFLRREDRLRAHAFSRAGMSTWLLVDGEAVLASCETYRMRSRHRGAEGVSHGVASVYVEPALRRRGHAAAMMDRLHEALLACDPSVHASLLFSDVGPALYARGGYAARPAEDLVFPVGRGDARATVDAILDERDLESALDAMPWPEDELLVLPTAAQLDWHLERARCYAGLLHVPLPPGAGARIGDACILWAGDLKHRRLVVLLLAAHTSSQAEALLDAARWAARDAALEEVRLWTGGVSPCALELGRGGRHLRREPRPAALPMVRGLAAPIDPGAFHFIPRALWI